MHFTRRLLERPLSGALVVSSLALGAVTMMASCSSDPDTRAGAPLPEAGPIDDSAAPDASAVPDDSGAVDAGPPLSDAATSDAGPRPVVCASASCATSLVTTLGGPALATMFGAEGYCALLQDGTVACWGQNENGQLGRGPAAGSDGSAMPARVSGLSNIVALDHTCAVDKDGATWCWGRGPFPGGDPFSGLANASTPVKLPIPPATRAALYAGSAKGPELSLAEFGVACGVVDDGVLCWGRNDSAQIAPLESPYTSSSLDPQLVPMPPGAKIRSIHIGMASFVLREDGTLLSWGFNPTIGRVSSLFPDPQPKPVALTGVTNVDTLEAVACAVAEGRVYCWRDVNSLEESFHDHALPERIPTPEPVVQVSTTGRPYARGCVVGVSGDVYCWGKNKSGVLGDGTTNDAVAPVKVVGLPGPASEVRTTDTSTCALLATGKVYCWGDDRSGQLGGGTKKPTFVPREVLLP